MSESKIYNKGELVEENGNYVCVPCGYHRYYRQGEQFTECMSCFSGTQKGHEDFVDGLEMWEKSTDQSIQ